MRTPHNEPQPAPLETDGQAVWDMVIADMRDRDRDGEKKYKRRLRVGDGRKSDIDAYQEVLDLAVYHKKAIIEREGLESRCADLQTKLEASERKVEEYRHAANLGGVPTGVTCTADPKDPHEIHGGFYTDGPEKTDKPVCLLHAYQTSERALAGAKLDTERMDWIGSHFVSVLCSGVEGQPPSSWIVDEYEKDDDGHQSESLRDAIDKARGGA